MSRKVPEEQYKKTRSYHLRQWLDGTKDPFLDTVEMKPQQEFKEDTTVTRQRSEEKKEIYERVFDVEHNAEMRLFQKIYRLFSVLFCISLVLVLLTGVSYLPTFGHAENPVNNEVPQRYIENGLQETGAVNIVTGMILDYRAFDTLGESHVLFIATCTVLILLRIDKKKGKGIPYVIAKAEAEGKPSRLNIAKEVVDYYIKESCNLRELEINLRKQGYICQFDYNRKYWTIRQKDWKKPIRLIQMGEEYSNECIRARVAEPKAHNKTKMRSFRKADVCYKVKKVKTKKVKGLKGLYFYYCYRLGCFPQKKQNSRYIHYIYRDDLLKLKNITDEAHLLCTQGIEDKKQLDAYKKRLESNIEALCEERKQLNNVIRRSTVSENKKSAAMDRKSKITKELKALRRQIYLCDGISRRSDIIREKISVEKAKVKEKEYTR